MAATIDPAGPGKRQELQGELQDLLNVCVDEQHEDALEDQKVQIGSRYPNPGRPFKKEQDQVRPKGGPMHEVLVHHAS